MSNIPVSGTVTSFTPAKGKGPATFQINNEPRDYKAWSDHIIPGFGIGAQVAFQAYDKEWAGQQQWNVGNDYETKQTSMKIISAASQPPPQASPSGAAIVTANQVPQQVDHKGEEIHASVALKAAVEFVNQKMIVAGEVSTASEVGLVFAYFKSLLSGKAEEVPAPKNIPGEPFNDPLTGPKPDSTVQHPVEFT